MGNNRLVCRGPKHEQECRPDNWESYIWTVTPHEKKVVKKIQMPITLTL